METESDSLLLNIKNSIKTNDKKNEKKVEIKLCNGAVKYNTIGDAYKAITDSKIKVYIYETIKNGKVNEVAYARCSKKAEDNDCVCHLHRRMRSTNPKGIKYFDKDILPFVNNNDNNGVKIRLANINDSYFDNMGKRGAKKKNKNTVIDFKSSNHPLLLAMQHKNPKILQDILIYARKQLKLSQDENDEKEIVSKKVDKKEKESTNLDLIKTINLLKESKNEELKKKEIEDVIEDEIKSDVDEDEIKSDVDEDEIKSDVDEDDEDEIKSDIIEDDEDEIKSDVIEDDEDEIKSDIIEDDNIIIEGLDENNNSLEDNGDSDLEDVDVVKITTIKGRDVYLDENTNLIYDTQDGYDSDKSIDSNESYTSKPLGKLTEINQKFSTVELNDKNYTVLSTLINNSIKYNLCVFTNKLFDDKLNHVGNIKEKRNSDEITFDIFKNKKSFNIRK